MNQLNLILRGEMLNYSNTIISLKHLIDKATTVYPICDTRDF